MNDVRLEIQKKENMSQLKKKKLWRAIKDSRIPLVLAVLTIVEGTVDYACGNWPFLFINGLRVSVFAEMSKEGIKQNINSIRQEKIERQFYEVQDEILHLQQIICSVADYQKK